MLRRFTVTGDSMEPSYHNGEVVVATSLLAPANGAVVVCRDPRERTRFLLKRITAIDNDRYSVVGDNRTESTDSRAFGTLSRSDIIGTVVYPR